MCRRKRFDHRRKFILKSFGWCRRDANYQLSCQAGPLVVTVPRVSDSEIRWAGLEGMGFQRDRTYTLYSQDPGSGLH